MTYTVSAKTYDPQTRAWTKDVTYTARDRMEALRWMNFNKDWMTNFVISDDNGNS